MTDLRKGPVVVEVPKATDKAMLFGQIADHWYQTFVDLGPIGVDKGTGAKILQIIDEGLRAGGIGIGSTLGYMRDGVTAREVNMRDSILFISGDILWNGPYWKILDNF